MRARNAKPPATASRPAGPPDLDGDPLSPAPEDWLLDAVAALEVPSPDRTGNRERKTP
jgi:hypothetical protein